jgi:hypothetical protein
MSRGGVLGLGLIGLGAVFAYFHETFTGLFFASVCLIVGLLAIVWSEVQGLVSKPRGASLNAAGRKQPQMLVVVKGEVHVYPQRDGKFQEIQDPHQSDLEFEVFIYCWLLLAAEMTLRIADLQLTLKGPDGSTKVGERVTGDLKKWRLRERRGSEEESDWPEGIIRKAPAGLAELDATAPLACGGPREGWLHFRFRSTTPSELKNGSLEFSFRDFFSHMHGAVASKVLLPGSVCPIPAIGPPEPDAKKDGEPPSS